jgi:hypothetical protein
MNLRLLYRQQRRLTPTPQQRSHVRLLWPCCRCCRTHFPASSCPLTPHTSPCRDCPTTPKEPT